MRHVGTLIALILWSFTIGSVLITKFEEQIGKLHGRIDPVLNPNLIITEFEFLEDGSTRVHGRAKKVRKECSPISGSMDWYEGAIGQPSVWRPSHFEDKPTKRDEGWTTWDGIVVGLDKNTIQNNSYSYISHKCGWWPWPVISVYYDSRNHTTPHPTISEQSK